MNTKIILSFFFIFLLLSTISYNSGALLGSQQDYIEDFEDDILGEQAHDNYFGSEWFYTKNESINTHVDDNHAYPYNFGGFGQKSYKLIDNGATLFTMNVSNIYNISFQAKRTGAEVGSNIHFQFNNATNHTIIEIRWTNDGTGDHYCSYQEWDDAWNRIGNDVDGDQPNDWGFFRFKITGIDTVIYEWCTDLEDGTPNHIGDNITKMNIRYVYWWYDSVSGTKYLNLDNFTIVPESITPPSGEDETIPPCSPDATIGKMALSGLSRGTTKPYLWTVYGISRVMYIHRLDLEIDELMITEGTTVNSIQAKINEFSLGNADELVQLGTNNDYRISWTGLNIFINNTPTTISFRNSGDNQWNIPYTTEDINDDGLNQWVIYNSDSWWNNHGKYITLMPHPFQVSGSEHFLGAELSVRMCVDKLATAEFNDDLNNYVEVFPNVAQQFQQLDITWILNSTAMTLPKVIWIDSPSIRWIARNLTTQTGHFYFSPTETGIYYFNLSVDGVNVSIDVCNVSGLLDDWIYTLPNPSEGGTFAIFYNYSGTQNGAIRIYDNEMNLLNTIYIAPTSNGVLSYQLIEHGNYNLHLTSIAEIGENVIYNVIYPYIHIVQGAIVNYIDVSPQIGLAKTPMLIFGEHSHVGQNINVYVGSSKLGSVSYSEQFQFEYTPLKSGEFVATLVLETPDGEKIILATKIFNVKDSDFFEPPPLIPKLNPAIAYPLGAIIEIVFILLPMLISGWLGYSRINVSPVVYLLTGSVGLVVNVGMGLWDFWAVFTVVAIGILALLFMYLIKGRG